MPPQLRLRRLMAVARVVERAVVVAAGQAQHRRRPLAEPAQVHRRPLLLAAVPLCLEVGRVVEGIPTARARFDVKVPIHRSLPEWRRST
jgi:hypothetical protein